ncbi:Mediator of DNA damage checkpoint protein [Hibiscus syriacus]|uniref:Mediator of DNA damage checkpoint protein n=1 Tax=Hibiscus syriacus TaxID=106335 RepID=A0A6A3BRU0_HIBSY|nr:Mediator of DNA damage checkpoint protein [Hibiscus syriacus]
MRVLSSIYRILPLAFVLFTIISSSHALVSSPPKAISDLKESVLKGLGFQADDFKFSGFDLSDALVGHSVAYEFDIEIDNKVIPFKLLEDVNRWEYVDLPIFRVEEPGRPGAENGLVEQEVVSDDGLPVLAPFQLAGPMELWLQDAKDMRISLPHDVDAGVLKKVILADGAVVTVKGARSSVGYMNCKTTPLALTENINIGGPSPEVNTVAPNSVHPKPEWTAGGIVLLIGKHSERTHGENFRKHFCFQHYVGLSITNTEHLRHASRNQDARVLSLRIVGPTSLTVPSSTSSNNKLKLKRLAPGLVELSSMSKTKTVDALSTIDIQGEALITPKHFATMWPLASVNGSNVNLVGFERLLSSVLGPKANKKGHFKLLKADVSAQTFVKLGFGIEKKLKEGDGFSLEGFPEWRTKPETVNMHFEVLAKVDGEKVIPERIVQVDPVVIEDTIAPNVLTGNLTMSTTPVVYPPSNPFTL